MPGRERNNEIVPASHGKLGLKKTENITNKATKSLKTKEGISETKLKRTQNEPHLSAGMRTSCIEFELFDTSHVLPEASNRKDDRAENRPGQGIQRAARKQKIVETNRRSA